MKRSEESTPRQCLEDVVDKCFDEILSSIWSHANDVEGLRHICSALAPGKKREDDLAPRCNIISRSETVKRIHEHMAENLEVSCIRSSLEVKHLGLVPNTEGYPGEGTSLCTQYAKKLFEKLRSRISVSVEKWYLPVAISRFVVRFSSFVSSSTCCVLFPYPRIHYCL